MFSSLMGYWDTAVEKGVNRLCASPKKIGAMFPASTIFLFNAVLRRLCIVGWNYLGGACTLCSILTQPSGKAGVDGREVSGETALAS